MYGFAREPVRGNMLDSIEDCREETELKRGREGQESPQISLEWGG